MFRARGALFSCLFFFTCLSYSFLTLGAPRPAVAVEESALRSQFQPYTQGSPHVSGVEPGMKLTRENVQLAQGVLPREILNLVIAGDFEITVQATTDVPPRPAYLDATIQHAQDVSLGGGEVLTNYRAGAPFPLLDPADPQAGQKLAWDLRYRDLGEGFELRAHPQQVNSSGGVSHSNRGHMRIRFGMYRPDPNNNDLEWQELGIYMKNSFELLAPSDQEGIISLRTIYDDDTRQTEQWRYSPQNRRTRKDRVNYITPIGGYYEMLQEEQPPFFFQGYLYEYDWKFGGAQVMLVPGFLKVPNVDYGGKNGWYPQVPWELRHVLVLECTPRNSHPFGRRVFFLDQQTYTPLLALTYDGTGAFIRAMITAHADPRNHPGNNGVLLPMIVGVSWINYAKESASRFTAGDTMMYNPGLSARRFEVMEILRKGK